MTKRYKNTFRVKVLKFIQKMGETVILRSDLKKLGEPRQISRALKALVEDGELVKFGYGVYIRAEKTPYSDKPVMLLPLAQATTESLNRLGIPWELSQMLRDYNEGKTQQVPVMFSVRLKERFRGKLGPEGRQVIFEGGINAR